MKTFPIIRNKETIVVDLTSKRQCGECTACCVHLSKVIFDEFFDLGVPCKYLDKKCTIYESRPIDPCRMFNCSWLHSPHMIPDWMKPSLSNVMLVNRPGYLAAIVCDISKEYEPAIQWLIDFHKDTKCNISITVEKNKILRFGDPKWVEKLREKNEKEN